MMMNVSLYTTNINAINISTPDFRIWQHFNSKWTTPHLQKLTYVPEVLVTQLYKHMINICEPVHSFTFNKDDDVPHMDNINASWDKRRDYWYNFHCMYRCLFL